MPQFTLYPFGGVGIGVFFGVAGKLGESDKRGVAGGVGGRDRGDESLRNEEVSMCVFSTSPEDDTRSVD